MRAQLLTAHELASLAPADLVGAVVLAPIRVAGRTLAKGSVLAAGDASLLADHAATLTGVRLAWPAPDDVHEDAAALRLAQAAAGHGIDIHPPRQSRVDLAASSAGVLHVHADGVRRLAAIEPLELFTLLHGQPVAGGEVVASVKVAPHLVPAAVVEAGAQVAHAAGPLVSVRAYRPHRVAALVLEQGSPQALERFEHGARLKLHTLGSALTRVVALGTAGSSITTAAVTTALQALVADGAELVLVGGVSAGDPTSPLFDALTTLGGRVVRRGVPAHPGSMIWLAELGTVPLLGLPQCGMFSEATAADLVLPRLLTGERLDAAALAELAVGGLLLPGMRFRFPDYGTAR